MQSEIIDQIATYFRKEFRFNDTPKTVLDQYEFEAILERPGKNKKGHINYEEFVNIFKYLKSEYTVLSQPETLDISGSKNLRVSLIGLEIIKEFMALKVLTDSDGKVQLSKKSTFEIIDEIMDDHEKNNKSTRNIQIIKKSQVCESEDHTEEYGIKFNLKREEKKKR